MFTKCLPPAIVALLTVLAFGEPTESKTWTSITGSTVTGSALQLKGGQVHLKLDNGRTLTVPLDKLLAEDRDYLTGHFGEESSGGAADSAAGQGSGLATVSDGLAQKVGEVVGPIGAGGGSHYFLYIPKSLRAGRSAPLLHYNDAGGGNARAVSEHIEGAEINGWIVAANVESRNGPDRWVPNHEHAQRTVEHLIKTLPIDPKRVYFTGASGGGAMSFYNAARIESAGAMPIIGYIPNDTKPKDGDYFVINGTTDYNRYSSAAAVESLGKDAIHRFFVGGHQGSPVWLRTEGMVWLNGRYLAKNRRDRTLAEELLDYETAMIQWIKQLSKEEPHRAYYWCTFLQDDYKISGPNASVLTPISTALASRPECVNYVKGIEAISQFSERHYNAMGAGSLFEHTTSKLESAAEKLAEKFAGVPMIEEMARELGKPTAKK